MHALFKELPASTGAAFTGFIVDADTSAVSFVNWDTSEARAGDYEAVFNVYDVAGAEDDDALAAADDAMKAADELSEPSASGRMRRATRRAPADAESRGAGGGRRPFHGHVQPVAPPRQGCGGWWISEVLRFSERCGPPLHQGPALLHAARRPHQAHNADNRPAAQGSAAASFTVV